MKNVMVRAWEIAREGAKKFGGKVKEYFAAALKLAWKEVKKVVELPELKGSEKQIAWAETIREELIEEYEEKKAKYIEDRKAKGKWTEKRQRITANNDKAIKELFMNESASFFIDKFQEADMRMIILRNYFIDRGLSNMLAEKLYKF